MNPLLDQAEDWLKVGQRSERQGLYNLATMRYTQAWTTLANLVVLRTANVISLAPEEESRLGILFRLLAVRLQNMASKAGNGHRKMSGPEAKDALSDVIRTLLEEMEDFG